MPAGKQAGVRLAALMQENVRNQWIEEKSVEFGFLETV